MTIIRDRLVDQISVDFAVTCAELARARLRGQEKESRANRALWPGATLGSMPSSICSSRHGMWAGRPARGVDTAAGPTTR
jgi:hypothetical protein